MKKRLDLIRYILEDNYGHVTHEFHLDLSSSFSVYFDFNEYFIKFGTLRV